MKFFIVAVLIAVAFAQLPDCDNSPIPNAKYFPGFCGFNVDTSRLNRTRQIELSPNGDLIVVEVNTGTIWAYFETEGGFQRFALFSDLSLKLNHAVRWFGNYLWASSMTTVYRWPYNGKTRVVLGAPQVVINGMPSGGHFSRGLEFDDKQRIYVNIGGGSNIDTNTSRAYVVRAKYSGGGVTLPLDYSNRAQVEVFANGTRNINMRFNPFTGDLWGVDNGPSFLPGGNFFNDNNPADEVHIFSEANKGKFYGFPYCWSEGYLEDGSPSILNGSTGAGSQHAQFASPDDAWCRNPKNVIRPAFPLRSHEAPLDIIFTEIPVIGKFFLTTSHGVGNRSISVFPLEKDGSPRQDLVAPKRLIYGDQGIWAVTPVSMVIAPCRVYHTCLFFTDDSVNGGIRAVAYTAAHERYRNLYSRDVQNFLNESK
eukprot:TRINITY_DN680_c0_g1_i1.p1 TRINITY_DN680_c0_g1~~TRINITY_DN680_c0_g1_i1.p1  ORF type:complete len:424 (+),score=128.38 TRINITY_DN680_c0_g1_i1:257-1528(+)